MIKKILVILGLVIAVLLVVIATRPSSYRISRSTTIAAAPATVFAEVNDFRRWRNWSPWENADPALQRSYSGAESGVGAVYDWAGNNQVGVGRMTIVESRPAELVRLKLEFFKPMAGLSETVITFEPRGAQTTVTWTMTGESGFMQKAVGLVMNMDKYLGDSFDQGLAALKQQAVKPANVR